MALLILIDVHFFVDNIESIHNTDYNDKISPSNNAYIKSYCHLKFQVLSHPIRNTWATACYFK